MKNLDKPLSPEEVRYLTDFLAKEHEANGALTIHQLRGFLWAVASSPEMIQPSEWLPVVLNDEEQGNMPFRHQADAERFMGVVLRLYNQINQSTNTQSNL